MYAALSHGRRVYSSLRHGGDPRSFGRPFAMRKWISSWLTKHHVPYVVGLCLSDPELPGYLPFAAESTGWTVWMPAGTWRATPWLLRLARQAEVKMLWLVDDNVRAVQVSYVDRVEETYIHIIHYAYGTISPFFAARSQGLCSHGCRGMFRVYDSESVPDAAPGSPTS